MISFCRICLNHITEDWNSTRLVDFYTYKKSENETCNISFFDVLSSCLPDLNLDIAIDCMPQICGCCSTKIVDLYDLKQQSLKVEKILLQYVKFYNNSNPSETVKLADVASMYNSIFKNNYLHVDVFDIVKQLYSASTKPLTKIDQLYDVNETALFFKYDSHRSKTNLNLKAISRSQEDTLILVEEEKCNNDYLVPDFTKSIGVKNTTETLVGNQSVKVSKNGSNEMSAETWLKLSQTNLLAERVDSKYSTVLINKAFPKLTTQGKHSNPKDMLIRNIREVMRQEISIKRNRNDLESPYARENRNVTSTGRKTHGLHMNIQHSSMMRNLRRYRTIEKCSVAINNIQSNNLLVRIPEIPQFVKDFAAKRKRTNFKIGRKRKWIRLRDEFKKKNRNGILNNQFENNIKEKFSNNKVQKSILNETLNKELNENTEIKSLSHKLQIISRSEPLSDELNEILPNESEKINKNYSISSEPKVTPKCKICEFNFENEKELKVHLCYTTSIQCTLCNFFFKNMNQWNQHKCNTSTSNDSNSLVLLQENRVDSLKTELQEADIDNPLHADLVPEIRADTKNHISCEICDTVYLTMADLTDHVAASHMLLMQKPSYIYPDSQPETTHLQHASGVKLQVHLGSEQEFQCNKGVPTFDAHLEKQDLIAETLEGRRKTSLWEMRNSQIGAQEEDFLLSHQKLQMVHVRNELFQCDECGQQFQYAYHLRRHKNIHSPRRCPICGVTLNLSHNLHAHILSAHSQLMSTDTAASITQEQIITPPISPIKNRTPIVVGQPSPKSEPISATKNHPKYICSKCGDFFTLKSVLELHEQNHSVDIKFKCHVCLEVFPSRPVFHLHKYLTCSNRCQFNNQCNIKHSGSINFNENVVQKRIGNIVFTKQSGSSLLYQCQMCKKKFISQKFLRNHFATHVRNSYMTQCKNCKVMFTNTHSLKRHMALTHPVNRLE